MKKRIFIIGAGPLPNEKEGIRDAGGLRTEQFIRPLQKEGHVIFCVLITSNAQKNNADQEGSDGIEYLRLSRHDKTLLSTVKKHAASFNPDLCIGVNTFPSFIMAKCLPKNHRSSGASCPFWADLNGWIMAEAQARSWSEDNNDIFANAWKQEKTILLKADKVSTVSINQKFSVIGEMASLGILQKENFREQKVFSIPNATKIFNIDNTEDTDVDTCLDSKYAKKQKINESTIKKTDVEVVKSTKEKRVKNNRIKNILRGERVPKESFVIAWIGGYNNWVDEETLFAALEKTMMTNDDVYFVSTGGTIKNIANSTFNRFIKKIEDSPIKDRFVFLGWIETADMKNIYLESDIGINADFLCIETETGARNRLNEMMKFGLPIVTTGGSEIAEIIGKEKAGITVKNEDIEAMTMALHKMATMSKEELLDFGQKGQYLSSQVFTDTQTLEPLLQYAKNPKKTHLPPLPINSISFYIQNIFWYIKKNSWKKVWGKVWQNIS